MSDNKPLTITTYAVVGLSTLSILGALILSYTALFDLFNNIGLFDWRLAFLFPLLFDLVEVSAAIAVFNAKLQDKEDEFAWRMVLAFTGLGIVANIIHAMYAYSTNVIDEKQLFLAIFATSLFPLSVALVTHLVKRVIERNLKAENLTLRNDEIIILKSELEQIRAITEQNKRLFESKAISLQKEILEALESKLELLQSKVEVDIVKPEKLINNSSKKEQLFKVLNEHHGSKTVDEILELSGVSRPTYYKYLPEYQANGVSK